MIDPPLAALRVRFLDRCRRDLRRLEDGVRGEELDLLVHRLAGIAGVFGFPEVSEIAGRIDRARSEGVMPSPAELEALKQALQSLPDQA